MLSSRRARGIAATLAVGVAAAAGAAVVTHGGGTTNALAASRTGSPPTGMGEGAGAPSGRRPGGGFGDDLSAAATYLGLSTSTLRTDLRSGKTLAQVAAATPGKTTSGLVAAIVAAEQKHVRSGGSTLSVAALTKRVEAMVAGQGPKRPGGGGGGPPPSA